MLSREEREQFIREGYVLVSGLIPSEVVSATRDRLLTALEIDPARPETWTGKNVPYQGAALTTDCRTPGIEAVAEELVGPRFLRGLCYSPYLDAQGVVPPTLAGF